MSWFATLIADIAAIFIKMIGGDIVEYFKKKETQTALNKANSDAAQASVNQLKNATTAKEVNDAATSAFDKT